MWKQAGCKDEIIQQLQDDLREQQHLVVTLDGEIQRLRSDLAAARAISVPVESAKSEAMEDWSYIRISSPITRVEHWERMPQGECSYWRWWSSWCPCCKRPLEITLFQESLFTDSPLPSGRPAEPAGFSPSVAMPHSENPNDVASSTASDEVMSSAHIKAMGIQATPNTFQATGGHEDNQVSELLLEETTTNNTMKLRNSVLNIAAEPFPTSPKQSSSLPAFVSSSPPGPRFAYATSLWGTSPGFVLGALALGQGLRRSGTKHDLVLMHTDDVPLSSCSILGQVWTLKQVEFIDADVGLFSMKGGRFDGVFTKLHALGLTEYEKVLMMDIDIVVMKCPDELFELRAPAAMCRGRSDAEHGSWIDGRLFFEGDLDEYDRSFEWMQHGGINAGVMLLAPDADLYARALREVTAECHPERIPGNGPEQDYLSRFFAPWWRHISVQYNFQLHHVFFAIESTLQSEAYYGWHNLPARLSLEIDDISLVHFSGEMNMWDRDFVSEETNEDFVDRLLRDCSPYGMHYWSDGAAEPDEYVEFGVRRCTATGSWQSLKHDAGHDEVVRTIINRGISKVRAVANCAATQWQADVKALAQRCSNLTSLPALLELVHNPHWPEKAAFKRNEAVEVYWKRTGNWYGGRVVAAHSDETFSVEFDEAGYWGTSCRHIQPDCLRHLDSGTSGGSGHGNENAVSTAWHTSSADWGN